MQKLLYACCVKGLHLQCLYVCGIAELCLKATFVDGVAYMLLEDSCAEFLQCLNDGTQITARRVSCPFETFYDDYNKVCRHSKQFRCWRGMSY